MLKQSYKDSIKAICRKYFADCNLFLFGSRARNDESFYSDIDLVINTQDRNNPKKRYFLSLIKEDLEESNIPYFVDLLDFDSLDEEFKRKIFEKTVEL